MSVKLNACYLFFHWKNKNKKCLEGVQYWAEEPGQNTHKWEEYMTIYRKNNEIQTEPFLSCGEKK